VERPAVPARLSRIAAGTYRKGHGFSRAINSTKGEGLQPEATSQNTHNDHPPGIRNQRTPRRSKFNRKYEALLTGAGLRITGTTPDATYVES
jgi:hypothetical protein